MWLCHPERNHMLSWLTFLTGGQDKCNSTSETCFSLSTEQTCALKPINNPTDCSGLFMARSDSFYLQQLNFFVKTVRVYSEENRCECKWTITLHINKIPLSAWVRALSAQLVQNYLFCFHFFHVMTWHPSSLLCNRYFHGWDALLYKQFLRFFLTSC